MSDPDRFHVPRRFVLPLSLALLAVVALLVAPFVARSLVPSISETDVQSAVVTTIQEEAPEAFLVTGTLRSSLTTTTQTTTNFLPGLLDIEVGRGEVEVRVPGRVAYGFDVRRLSASDVRLLEGEAGEPIVQVELPPLAVFSVEPILEQVAVRTDRGGWVRPSRDDEQRQIAEALGRVRPALRQQGETHLRNNAQPARNTAEAVVAQLRGPLAALDLEDPTFRFRLPDGETLTLGPRGDADRVIVGPSEEASPEE
ncbi:MAG: DUF4230 domain-containing protein [Bacteroidota bacterium]